MIYTDLEGIFDRTGIENKYALAMIVATRARQLSERKDAIMSGDGSEMCISRTIDEVEHIMLDIDNPVTGAVIPNVSVAG